MPLVKKRSQLQRVQCQIKYYLEQLTNTSIREQELLLLLQWILLEQRLLIQQWTSPSTMQNLQRMHRYRHSLLDSHLDGKERDMCLTIWSQLGKSETDLLLPLKTVQPLQEQ